MAQIENLGVVVTGRMAKQADTGGLSLSRMAGPQTARPLSLALSQRNDVPWVTIGAGGTDVAAQLQSRSAADRDDLLLERLPRQTQVLGFTVQSVMHSYFRASGAE